MSASMIFLSHTSALARQPAGRSFVNAALDAIAEACCVPRDMRYFTADDRTPAQICIEAVRQCSVYVGLFGLEYGSPVRDRPEISYTELEFLTALEEKQRRGLRVFAFLLDEAEASPELGSLQGRQAAFRQRVLDSGVTAAYFTTPDGLQHALFRTLTGKLPLPCLLYDGLFVDGNRANVAFNIVNRSNTLAVVCDITVSVLFFNELAVPRGLGASTYVPRSVLEVNLAEAVNSPPSRSLSRGEVGGEGKQVSLIDPRGAIHIPAGAAESYLLSVVGTIDQGVGHVCLFVVQAHVSSETDAERTITLPHVFEAVADPFAGRFRLIGHPMADVLPLVGFFRGDRGGRMVGDVVEVIRRVDFSGGFLHAIQPMVDDSEQAALYLHLANAGGEKRRECALWLSALQSALGSAPPDFAVRYHEPLSELFASSYPYRHRLIAARLLAGCPSFSDQTFKHSSHCGSLIRFCHEILDAPRAEDYDKRTYGQVGDKGLAIETLCEIASQESLGVLVQFITQEKKDIQALKKAIGEAERLAGRRFIRGYQWESDWGLRSLCMSAAFGFLGMLLGAWLTAWVVKSGASEWFAWLAFPAMMAGFIAGMLAGVWPSIRLWLWVERKGLERAASRVHDWYGEVRHSIHGGCRRTAGQPEPVPAIRPE
jgi:hypothetical protein